MSAMTTRAKLTVAYLGGGFSGWQRQDSQRTVQGDLEQCLDRLTKGRRIAVVGAGRTDAGVHAAAQVAHIDLDTPIPVSALPKAMNERLRPDLRIRSAVSVPASFHARKSAVGKHYAYRILCREPDLPWLGIRAAVMPRIRFPERLAAACREIPGRRDWASFTVPEVAARSSVRRVFRTGLRWSDRGLELHFFGEGFLRYQVRRMVAALVEVGSGRMHIEDFLDLLERPTPGAPLPTAPARGLTLEKVYYRRSPKLAPEPTVVWAEDDGSLW
jgi:tRNA pseudouridine38-40 synthase